VETPGGRINLKVIPISQLRPHEQTVARLSEDLTKAILKDGVQRDPIVVDQGSGIVLDGMHRLESLREIGARSAVAYLVDYADPRVKLYRWYRFVKKPGDEVARDIIDELGLESIGPVGAGAQAAPATRLLVTYRGEAFGAEITGDIAEDTRVMRAFDLAVARRGLQVEFMDEASASSGLLAGDDLFLLTPKFAKEDVLRAGREGRLFPPKSTLHVFPIRPLGLNYPVEDLRAGRDVLESVVSSRRPRLIEAPFSFRGRVYREGIVVFE
jgi:ParB-like nuclease domain